MSVAAHFCRSIFKFKPSFMKKILVPTDFSPNADKALDFAVQIAKKAKARIILVHVCDLLDLSVKNDLWLKKEHNKKIVTAAREKFAAYKESIINKESMVIQTILYDGLITDTLIDAVTLYGPDMIVMGTLGSSGAPERIFGSKTAALIGKVNVPVLAVPLLSEWAGPENILLALNNFNEGRPVIISAATELAELFNCRLTVVKFSETADASPEKDEAIAKAGNSYARKLQSFSVNMKPVFAHIKGHKFEKTLEKYISKNNIDMMVMITHKRGFLKNLFHRSMTKKMSYHLNIPLLAIPAKPVL